jgi:hypothetical protein
MVDAFTFLMVLAALVTCIAGASNALAPLDLRIKPIAGNSGDTRPRPAVRANSIQPRDTSITTSKPQQGELTLRDAYATDIPLMSGTSYSPTSGAALAEGHRA